MTEHVVSPFPLHWLLMLCYSFSPPSRLWFCPIITWQNGNRWSFLAKFFSIEPTLTSWHVISPMRQTLRWWWTYSGTRAKTFNSRRFMCSRYVSRRYMRSFFMDLRLACQFADWSIGIRRKPQEAATDRNHFTKKQGQAVKLSQVIP